MRGKNYEISKKQDIWFGVIALSGLVGAVVCLLSNNEDKMVFSLCCSFAAIGILKLAQFWRLSRDPQRVKKFEMLQTEERLAFITEKSRSLMFIISIYLQFIVMAIAMLSGREELCRWLCFLIGAEGVVYLIIYYCFNRKY